MTGPPSVASLQDYLARLGDVGFWWPFVSDILARHGLTDAGQELVAGYNSTYPTFLYGDVVVKLFGQVPAWRATYDGERAAVVRVSTDLEIAVPRLLGAGNLSDDTDAPWPYLITTRMPGEASWRADLSPEQRLALAADVGRQIGRVHALPKAGIVTHAAWATVDVTEAAERSSLPPHLVAQVADYVAQLARRCPPDPVFTHCDIVANHVYVQDGRFTGIIDWGDAIVADRHLEIIQVYRDLFRCDKDELRVFLEASEWPVGTDFPRQALGMALHRQAVGLAQHTTIDVFMPIAAKFPLREIATLDDLAQELFAI
jgi:hygromycin-B 7''-O-kinase